MPRPVGGIEGSAFQGLAPIQMTQQDAFGPMGRGMPATQMTPEKQRVHAPGIIGVFAQALAYDRRQRVEGVPVRAGMAEPHLVPQGAVIAH